MKTLIKSATIIDASSEYHLQTKDILIENGTIIQIDDVINESVSNEINLPNLHVSQGWFDSSVSFGEPGYEERETLENGLLTAAKSGFTSIAVNSNTKPVSDSKSAISFLSSKAIGNAVNLFPIGAMTMKSESVDLAEMYDMHTGGAIAFGDYKVPVSNPNLLKIALLYAQNFGGLIQSFPHEKKIAGKGVVHEEANATRLGLKGIPALAESLQVARDLFILEYTGGKLHIPTISTEASVKAIKEAKAKGLDVTCSVAIHNLFFTDAVLDNFNSNFKVLPPLRTENEVTILREAVLDGTIDFVTSDHMPIDIENKKLEFDLAEYGTLGLETAFGALNKLFGAEKAVTLLINSKERFGIPSNTIQVGSKAELSLFNPGESFVFTSKHIYSSTKNSAFIGSKLQGKAYGIYNNNQLVTF
ncbi:dihydroorotase [Pustulibacterium marinum]|uniref:Dihydroorotase n=1 Tax=Pustulibacterium marinum TaxID=1224947 RepID=A0A1I7ID21_9FLAO|nr:dihydroorotase [Pustulibacterium marinum]SFU70834.1 dihydroorotase [Pustulibacterium marinum]